MAERKNILYISYDGMTDPLGRSQVIPYLAALSKNGFDFTIISFEKRSRYREDKVSVQNVLDSAGIRWSPLSYTKWPPVLSTLFDYMRLKRRAVYLHKSVKYDLVHCRSYIPALAALVFKRKYKLPFIFDMRGFWADERVDGKLWDMKNPLFKFIYEFFKKKELEFLRESAAVITLTQVAREEILRWKTLQINPKKITIIPCCADTELFDPKKISTSQQELIRNRLNISKADFVLGYLGSTGTWYLLNEMLQFFAELKKHVARARFLFVTHDDTGQILEAAVQFHIDKDDIIVTRAERKEVPLMVSLFNYGIFFIRPSYSKMASSPTKQGEIMAMGIPVICNAGVGDSDNIVQSYNSGFVVSMNDYNAVVRRLLAAKFDPQSIRNGAEDYFSLTRGVNAYLNVYHHIFNSV